MAFCRLHRNITVLADGIFTGQIPLECMSAFMGDHIHIPAGPIEIGKIKGA